MEYTGRELYDIALGLTAEYAELHSFEEAKSIVKSTGFDPDSGNYATDEELSRIVAIFDDLLGEPADPKVAPRSPYFTQQLAEEPVKETVSTALPPIAGLSFLPDVAKHSHQVAPGHALASQR
jgi:hypothetical protein